MTHNAYPPSEPNSIHNRSERAHPFFFFPSLFPLSLPFNRLDSHELYKTRRAKGVLPIHIHIATTTAEPNRKTVAAHGESAVTRWL